MIPRGADARPPVDHGRRGLFRGALRGRRPPVRPPWTDDARLDAVCSRCGGCAPACPEGVIRIGDGGFPEIDPAAGLCTFCGACASACTTGAFDTARSPAWQVQARVETASCLAFAGIHCEACRDACPERAIRIERRIGYPPVPRIDAAVCTGCGGCVGGCPGAAIALIDTARTGRSA